MGRLYNLPPAAQTARLSSLGSLGSLVAVCQKTISEDLRKREITIRIRTPLSSAGDGPAGGLD
ncbi:hypothetical protein CCM_03773 [Cordyceps militaris CM01]|uniref:Uncharacterized protein n=1 Tax=Cordyceps militaris (strain CM01) TaxID=983644 RepID=G3JGI3_CORMM|nr:uncharacterized protein CCM_03773 [Cordyceps militaris CM01]EGX92400.1 hypothetical protein CCM_03773 [Cordyceps militaris CM01]